MRKGIEGLRNGKDGLKRRNKSEFNISFPGGKKKIA